MSSPGNFGGTRLPSQRFEPGTRRALRSKLMKGMNFRCDVSVTFLSNSHIAEHPTG
jgi:hypothetical protein